MQIMPATGRRLGRDLGIRRVSVLQFHVPEISLKPCTLYLCKVLDPYQGKIKPALAGHNAGEHRADK